MAEPTPTYLPSIISATAGLVGVIVGAAIAWIREEVKEYRTRKADARYAAAMLAGHLEKLARECLAVANDVGRDEDGVPAGYHDGDRFFEPTTDAPTFEPVSLGLNYKALDRELMAEIIDLPAVIADVERCSHLHLDRNEFPPYDGSYFPHRRALYAELTLKVLALYRELRAKLGYGNVSPARMQAMFAAAKRAEDDARASIKDYKAFERKRRAAEKRSFDQLPIPPAGS